MKTATAIVTADADSIDWESAGAGSGASGDVVSSPAGECAHALAPGPTRPSSADRSLAARERFLLFS